MTTITLPRAVVEQALKALEGAAECVQQNYLPDKCGHDWDEQIIALRAALGQQGNKIPITDDNGKALRPQYQVIEQIGNWYLLYDQHQSGEVVRHEFRIQKLRHDIALYPGISLAEAQKRFHERVEADNE